MNYGAALVVVILGGCGSPIPGAIAFFEAVQASQPWINAVQAGQPWLDAAQARQPWMDAQEEIGG